MAIIEQRLDMLFYQRAIAIVSATPHVSIFQVTPREEKGRGGSMGPSDKRGLVGNYLRDDE